MRDELYDRIATVFGEVLGEAPVRGPATLPQDVEGWDSLGHIRLVHALEMEFNCLLDEESLMIGPSLGTLVAGVRAATPVR